MISFASVDVSFISLTKILLPARALLSNTGEMVCLIKPQFEAGRDKVGRKGVVREKSTHLEVIEAVMVFARSIGFEILNLEYSPIKGPEGNIEYLLYLQNCPSGDGKVEEMLEAAGETGDGAAGEGGGVRRAKRRTETGQPKLQSPRCPVDARAVVDAAHKSL